jgi:hypothetical protein
MSILGKKKRRPTLSFADPSSLTQTLTTQSQLPSQLVTPSLFATEQNTQGDTSAGTHMHSSSILTWSFPTLSVFPF